MTPAEVNALAKGDTVWVLGTEPLEAEVVSAGPRRITVNNRHFYRSNFSPDQAERVFFATEREAHIALLERARNQRTNLMAQADREAEKAQAELVWLEEHPE